MSHLLLRDEKLRPGFRPTRLLSSCALAAVAAVTLYPQAASAQAFDGTPQVVTGSADFSRNITPTPGSETITVNSSQTIINWQTPSAGTDPFPFLPEANTANFENGDIGDYLVINRILPGDNNAPRMDLLGDVNSTLFGSQGGRIWFYSPGGILVGANAVFNVGSLLLTANEPVDLGYGTFNFAATAGSTAAVVNQGTINARGSNAYVAMIAPRVRQAGVVTVAGSAAYVAAEIVDLTINGTLFDINVSVGSDADGTGQTTLEHQGTTTTELEVGYGTLPRQVVMVAVPKNDAVTMLVGGTLGYAQASEAVNSGGRIILSAGYNVSGTEITSRAGDTQASADISIGTSDFNAVTEGRATGGAIVQATTGTSINFANRLSLSGGVRAQIIATNGDINIGGDLLLSSDDLETGDAGEALLEAAAGNTITIGGGATVSADAGWADSDSLVGADAVGGSASVIVGAGGSISVGGDLDVTATAEGGFGSEGGGNGQGGIATVSITGGTLTAGDLLVDTTGIGGSEEGGSLGNGGGTGGTSLVEVLDGSTLTLTSDSVPQDLEVFAIGGRQPNADISLNGPGQGGTASVVVRNSTLSLDTIDVKASAEGGNGPDPQVEGPAAAGYDGTGGTASVELASAVGTISLVEIDADGVGGQGGFGTTGGAGGTGRGGTASLLVTGNTPVINTIELEADGTGGTGGDAFEGQNGLVGNGGAGGAGFGGTATAEATSGGTLNITSYTFDVTGRGGFGGSGSNGASSGNGGAGGSGTGGTLELVADGGTITASIDGTFSLRAQGFGGDGGFAGTSDGGTQGVRGNGGDGFGGTVLLDALNNGLISTASFTTLDASGEGGYSFESSGNGTGGSAIIQAFGGGQVNLLGGADLYAYGFGGSDQTVFPCDSFPCPVNPTQNAGDGFGGLASINGTGVINIDGAYLDAGGYGGSAFSGVSGSGQGGRAFIEANAGASFDFGSSVTLEAGGYGGGAGGNGTGGTARLSVLGSSVLTDDLFVNASGFGDRFGGSTGTGTGGTASVLITNGGSLNVTFDTIVVADGNTGTIFGNGGGSIICPVNCLVIAPPPIFLFGGGGDGVGGTVTVSVDGTLITPDLHASAKGVGGPGGFEGVGGTATVEFLSGGSQIDIVTVDARGGGGEGAGSAPGGDGTGGTATLRVAGGAPVLGELAVFAGGFGGPGGAGINPSGTPFDGGSGGTGIGGTAIIEAGLGGTLTLDTFDFDASGQGGAGGAGASDVQFGADGGDGGDGIGGTVELRTTGGTIDIVNPDGIELTAYGIGGVGGVGGNTIDGAGPDGSGGDGGDGTGGFALINVIGGSVTSPETILDSSGFGGGGGAAGTGAGGGVAGAAGNGAGGVSRISVADGNGVSGNAALGFVTMISDGFNGDGFSLGTAGRLIIEDLGTVAGGLDMDGLRAQSIGQAGATGPAFAFTSTEGTVDVAGNVFISVDGDIVLSAAGTGGLSATGSVQAFTDGSISLDHTARAAGAATVSGGSILFDALAGITGSADSLVQATALDARFVAPLVTLGRVTAVRDVRISSTGNVGVQFGQAGDDFVATVGGTFAAGSVITTGLGPDADLSGAPPDGSNIRIQSTGDLRLDNGDSVGTIRLTSSTGSVLSDGTLDAPTLLVTSAQDIALNDVFVINDLTLTATGGGISGNSFNSDGSISLTSFDALVLTGGLDAGTFINLVTTGAGSDINTGALTAGGNIFVSSSGDIAVTSAASGFDIFMDAAGIADLGILTAARDINLFGASLLVDSATAGRDVRMDSAGNIVVGFAQAGDDFKATAGGTFTAGTVITTGLGEDLDREDEVILLALPGGGGTKLFLVDGSIIQVQAAGDLRLDDGDATDSIELTSLQGSVLSDVRLRAGTQLDLSAALDILINAGQSGSSTLLTAGNDLVATSLVAGADIIGTAGNDITIGSMVAGVTGPFAAGTFVVDALANSAAGGTLLGTFAVEAGQTISVSSSTNDLWSAGALPRFSDGDGLVATRFATASDDSGQPVGTQIGSNFGSLSQNGLSAPFGALVGEVGGTFFLLGANGSASAPASGTLNLAYWDANAGDNTGNITFGVTAGTPPAVGQGFITLRAGGDAVVGSAIAGGSINISAASIDLANASAGLDVTLGAVGAIVVGMAQVGDDFRADAGTTFAGDSVTATGLGPDSEADPIGDGSNIVIAANGDLRLDDGSAPDTIDLASQTGSVLSSGTLQANSLLVDAAFDIALNDVFVVSDLNLNAAGGGISGNSFNSDGSISLTSFDAITLTAGADAGTFITLSTTGVGSDISAGALTANDDITVDSDGAITLASATSTNGEIDLEADGAVTAGTLSSGASTSIESETSITVTSVAANLAGLPSSEIQGFSATTAGTINVGTATAENIGLGAFGNITAGSLTADNLVAIFTESDANLGTVTAGGLFYAGSTSTAISQTIFDGGLSEAQVVAALLGAPRVPTGGDILISGAVDAGQVLLLAGGLIDFSSIDSATTVDLDSQTGVSGDVILAGGNVNLEGNGGAVAVGTNLASTGVVDATGTGVTLNSSGALSVRTAVATAGNIALGAGGNLAIANADASGNVAANAGGTLSLTGNVVGGQINLSSTDIAVAPAARIGTLARTSLIDIFANGANVVLGGAAGGTGYRLDNVELGSFAAQNIAFIGSGNVRVENATIRGATAASPNVGQEFAIESAGGIDVVGDLALQSASSTNVLRLTASGEVFVDAATASIIVTNGTALAGTLEIEGESITVATQAAADEAAAATSTDARDRRLAQNDGATDEGGTIQAADVVLAAADHIWVQNSGASILTNDRRGITAGPSTIRLVATGSGPVEIIINGRQENGSGGFITGRDLIPAVIIEGEASPAFTDRSTINGCLIASPVCTSGGSPDLPTIQDFIEEVFGDGDEENPQGTFTRPPLLRLSSLIRLADFPFAPVVDDPVTGAGNEDFIDPASISQGENIGDPVTGSGRELDCEDEDRDDPRCEEDRRNRPNP